jgi:galactokinase/galacturonokinase
MLQSFPTVNEQKRSATAVLTNTFSVNPSEMHRLFVPYRMSPLGAHVDHQGGQILGRTLQAGTALVYAPLDEPEIRLASINFPGVINFTLETAVQPDHWARYAQAAALALRRSYPLTRGFAGVSNGALIGTGLGSSASVGLAYLQALADVNAITLTQEELVELDFQLERNLGLQNGIQDQANILFGREKSLLHLDARSRQTCLIPDPPEAATAGWLIVYSGVSRSLTSGGGYNNRVAECRAAAQWLEPTAVTLSDVPPEQFTSRANAMPVILRRRAAHYFSEVARVATGTQAWQAGDLPCFGALMNESCASSIQQYESGHEAVIALQQLVSGAPGVFGSRFSGGGYGGCVIGLVERGQVETAVARIKQAYQQQYPALAGEAAFYWEAG